MIILQATGVALGQNFNISDYQLCWIKIECGGSMLRLLPLSRKRTRSPRSPRLATRFERINPSLSFFPKSLSWRFLRDSIWSPPKICCLTIGRKVAKKILSSSRNQCLYSWASLHDTRSEGEKTIRLPNPTETENWGWKEHNLNEKWFTKILRRFRVRLVLNEEPVLRSSSITLLFWAQDAYIVHAVRRSEGKWHQ